MNVVAPSNRRKFFESGQPPQTNLQNWYTFRGEDVTIATGISAVVDRMGNKDLEQATTAEQPAWVESGMAGRPVAQFDGTDDTLKSVSTWSALSQPFTIAAAVQSISGSFDTLIGEYANAWRGLAIDASKWSIYDGSTNLLSSTSFDTSTHVFVNKFLTGAATDEIRLDGVSDVIGAGGGALTLTGLTVGANGGGSNYANFYLGELMIYTDEVTGSDLTDLENYLGGKWGTN